MMIDDNNLDNNNDDNNTSGKPANNFFEIYRKFVH